MQGLISRGFRYQRRRCWYSYRNLLENGCTLGRVKSVGTVQDELSVSRLVAQFIEETYVFRPSRYAYAEVLFR